MKKYNYHTQDFKRLDILDVAHAERWLANRKISFKKLDRNAGCVYTIDGEAFLGNNVIAKSANGKTPFAMNRLYTITEYRIFGDKNKFILSVSGGYFQPIPFLCELEIKGNKIIISNFKDQHNVVYYPHYRQREDIDAKTKKFTKRPYQKSKSWNKLI